MVLHLKEFENSDSRHSRFLNYYDKLPEYLHEMPVQEIMEHINRNGERSRYMQQTSIISYFIWLHMTYGIDLMMKNYELQQLLNQENKSFVGFYTLAELKQAIKNGLSKAEDENNAMLPDYSGLIAIFYLEWYGVLPDSAITIKLTDVSDDGREVFVPVENRTIAIDEEEVADYFAEYKQKTGFQRYKNSDEITPYAQSTFYRNTARRGGAITVKTIYNIRQKFITSCEDNRFAKKRIYYSGRYVALFQAETKRGLEFTCVDDDSHNIICKIFNDELKQNVIATILREYRVFKQGYLERI